MTDATITKKFGRENLKEEWADCLISETLVYDAVAADEVMDVMEARIKELEAELRKQKAWKNYTGNVLMSQI